MNAQLTEIMRLITNLIRTGTVTEVDRENWLCRVKVGELETNWINWLTLRAGGARTWWCASPDEQVVVLGMGESRYTDLFGWAQWKYAGRLAASFQMNHRLAHHIYAGADLFLMPSMFEPCGLSQLISLRYGTLPITRETGGLRDTVLSYNEYTGEGNGFTFFNYNAHDMLHVVERAAGIYYRQPDVFKMLAARAMKGEYGWDQSARKYLALYEGLTGLKTRLPEMVVAEPETKQESGSAAENPSDLEIVVSEAPVKEKKPRKPRAKKPSEGTETTEKPAKRRTKKTEETDK